MESPVASKQAAAITMVSRDAANGRKAEEEAEQKKIEFFSGKAYKFFELFAGD